MMKLASAAFALALAGALSSGVADAADETLKKALSDYGVAAGKVVASAPFCGAPPEEVEYAIRQVRELAEKAGAGPVEWSVIQVAMKKTQETATFTNHDCTDYGGLELFKTLMLAQRALEAALH